MCGRYASARRVEDLAESFGIRPDCVVDRPDVSYNVAPTDPVPAVLARRSEPEVRELRSLRWGLVPFWSADARGAARRINARVETVAERPAFRGALAARRCLLPADGYYEWATGPGGKSPYFLHARTGEPLAFAGLYERWPDPAGTTRWTCTILTTSAVGPLVGLHDRMPMIVSPADWSAWLDPRRTDGPTALGLARCPADQLAAYPVHRRVGNVRSTGPELLAPLAGTDVPLPYGAVPG